MVNSVAVSVFTEVLIERSSLCTVKMGGPPQDPGPSSIYVRNTYCEKSSLKISESACRLVSLVVDGIRFRVDLFLDTVELWSWPAHKEGVEL